MRLLVAAVLVFACGVAQADDPTVVARDHYNKGTTLFDLGRYREAAAEYEAAYQAKNDPALLFNIAQVYRLAGDNAKAVTFYRSYLRRVPNATNRGEVEEKIAELQKASEQQERAKQGPPEGTMKPDEMARKPAEASSTPGSPAQQKPAPPMLGSNEPKEQWRDTGRTKRLAGIGSVAGGVALVALGGVFVGLASQANGQVIASDGRFSASAEDRRDNYQIADAVCFAVGGAVIVTGFVLWIVGKREASRLRASAPSGLGRVAANLSVSF